MHDVNVARLMEVTAYNLYSACLVGNPAPFVARLYEQMKSPQSGDVVLEVSTIYDESRTGTRLGRLVRVAAEPVFTATEWAEGGGRPDEPIPTERVWYIALDGGREFRWTNATFIRVPETIASQL
jgi:hypothetical protein